MSGKESCFGFNNNQLKIIALIAMTCDHMGKLLFPELKVLQIIGRFAFPIFAYMIAEGCTYTRNMKKYFGMTAGVALICQIVYFVTMQSLYMCVMVTFALSIVLIAIIKKAQQTKNTRSATLWWFVFGFSIIATFFLCSILPNLPTGTDYYIDYGMIGVMLPVIIYVYNSKVTKLVATTLMLILLGSYLGGLQWFALMAVLLLALYNNERGKLRLKYVFYIYYPLHMAAIYGISMLIQL